MLSILVRVYCTRNEMKLLSSSTYSVLVHIRMYIGVFLEIFRRGGRLIERHALGLKYIEHALSIVGLLWKIMDVA